MFFIFCEARHVPSTLRMRRGIPCACLTLIYQQLMARIATVSEACGPVHYAVYTSRGEFAAPRLNLPLPQVYFQLYICMTLKHLWALGRGIQKSLCDPGEKWTNQLANIFIFVFRRLKTTYRQSYHSVANIYHIAGQDLNASILKWCAQILGYISDGSVWLIFISESIE